MWTVLGKPGSGLPYPQATAEMPPLGVPSEQSVQVDYGEVAITLHRYTIDGKSGFRSLPLVRLLDGPVLGIRSSPEVAPVTLDESPPSPAHSFLICKIEVDNLEVPSSSKTLIPCQTSLHK